MGLGDIEQLNLVFEFSAGVNADGENLLTSIERGSQPNLVVPDNWRGPAAAGDIRFPGDIFLFIPGVGRVAVRIDYSSQARGPAKLWPGWLGGTGLKN